MGGAFVKQTQASGPSFAAIVSESESMVAKTTELCCAWLDWLFCCVSAHRKLRLSRDRMVCVRACVREREREREWFIHECFYI